MRGKASEFFRGASVAWRAGTGPTVEGYGEAGLLIGSHLTPSSDFPQLFVLFRAGRSSGSSLTLKPALDAANREGVLARDVVEAVVPAGRAGVARVHRGAEQDRPAPGHRRAQARDPFGGLPIGHAGVGQAGERKNRRIVL